MRLALCIALAILATPAQAAPIATCMPNEGILQTVRELSLFGVEYDLTDSPSIIAAFARMTGFSGDLALIKRLLWMFGKPDGHSIVWLMGAENTCHRMGAPTAAVRSLHVQLVGVRA